MFIFWFLGNRKQLKFGVLSKLTGRMLNNCRLQNSYSHPPLPKDPNLRQFGRSFISNLIARHMNTNLQRSSTNPTQIKDLRCELGELGLVGTFSQLTNSKRKILHSSSQRGLKNKTNSRKPN